MILTELARLSIIEHHHTISMLQIRILVLRGQQETVSMATLQTRELQVRAMHRQGFIIALIKDNQFIRGSKKLRADRS